MYRFFLTLLILDALALLLVVLLQSGKGAGLAAEFGGTSSSSESFLGGRQAATLLTRASWVTGGLFLGLALILAILSTRTFAPASVLEDQFSPATTQEVPTSILQREQEGEAAAGTEESGTSSEEGSGQQDQPPPKSEQ